MFTTSNDELVGVMFRQDRSTGNRPSLTGDAQYLSVDLTEEPHTEWDWETWIDFKSKRNVKMRGEDYDVEAVWEVREHILEKLSEIEGGRELRAGDKVRFASKPKRWYVLQDRAHDQGMFNSIPMHKYNLITHRKGRR